MTSMIGRTSTQTPIAICSCGSSFYDTDEGIDRMNSHITLQNYTVHQWTYVIALTDNEGDKED